VRVLGALFRRLFLTRLIALHGAGRLAFFGSMAPLADRRAFLRHLSPVRKKRWVVYAKPPFAGPEAVLAYLSRYTHRVAISNRRLIAFEEGKVTFRYKDYRRSGADRQQVMTLAADKFIRRFLLHVLPRGFHRIRHWPARRFLVQNQPGTGTYPARGRSNTDRRSGRRADRRPSTLSMLRRTHGHRPKASPGGSNPAPRRNRPRRSGRSRRDPARPETTAPRRDCASGNDSARPVDGHRIASGRSRSASRPTNSPQSVSMSPASIPANLGRHPVDEAFTRPDHEKPIAQIMWTAGSFFGDFRTPAGARNSLRKE
jgi:hypothetical protein